MNTFFVFLLLFPALCNCHLDYYWKDYIGKVPDDAFPAGKDRNQNPTYVGQVYIQGHGILPSTIYSGQEYVTVSKNGIHTSNSFVKILCTNRSDKLSWVLTGARTLQNDTMGKHLVVGGTENGQELSVGRVAYQGQVIVGKVCSYNVDEAKLYLPFQGKEEVFDTYEVLVYDNSTHF